MQIIRESIFVSAIRSFFNTFLAVIGVILALVIFSIIAGAFSSPYQTGDDSIEIEILPDAKGDTTVLAETSPVILQIDISGVIGEAHFTGSSIEAFLRASQKGVMKNNRVKAILLNIDSPGGGAIDSDLIHHAITTYKKAYSVPVYAYTPGLCASGGYMIACAADKIYANSSSIVGSVGCLLPLGFNFWKFMQTHGIDSVTITDGLYKQKYPSFTKPEEGSASYNDLIGIVKEGYTQFINLVASSRSDKGLTADLLRSTYGAQVFTGMTAEKLGYVDNGNAYYLDALTDLVKASNLEDTSYQLVKFNYKHSPLQDLITNKLTLWLEETRSALLGVKIEGKLNNTLLYHYDPQDRLK